MKKITLSLVMLLVLNAAQLGQDARAAWNASWTKRAKISLNTSNDGLGITTATESVPVVVRLHTGNFQFLDAKPDGSDLRFVLADDKTVLKHHIEKWDAINELAIVWVQVPKVVPGSKAEFVWLYYGNANAPAANDPKATYDAATGLVYHFGENEPLPQDSSANGNHAAASTAKPSGAGLIGAGVSFDGTGEITINDSPSLKASATGETVSMWIKPSELVNATLFSQQEGSSGLSLLVRDGKLVAQSGALSTPPGGALAAATWMHVALVVRDGLAVFLNGQEVGRIGGAVPQVGGKLLIGRGFKGDMDELQVASVGRSADWIKLAAGSQGPDQKFVSTAPAEGGSEESGPSYLRILLGAVTLDGWVVIGILMIMFVISIFVMVSKAMYVARMARVNESFKAAFDGLLSSVRFDETDEEIKAHHAQNASSFGSAQLYHLYSTGMSELRARFVSYRKEGRPPHLTAPSLAAIRATVDARLIRELQNLNSKMVLLTICIAGGPFLGLLGTVVGVMITFAAIAAAGDVNVNAIAPGIAAALVATVAGLAVAIPALFAYNYLTGRISDLTADMQVFVDELITRIAETYSS
jgi:biopolymer transport protein ExbB